MTDATARDRPESQSSTDPREVTALSSPRKRSGGQKTTDVRCSNAPASATPRRKTKIESHRSSDDQKDAALDTSTPLDRAESQPTPDRHLAPALGATSPLDRAESQRVLDARTPTALGSSMTGGCDVETPKVGGFYVTPAVRSLTQELVALQKSRVMCIKETNGSVSRIEHLMVEMLGHDGTEKGRKAAFARVRSYRLRLEKSGEDLSQADPPQSSVLSGLTPLILQSYQARAQWPVLRKTIEKDMERIAQGLPGVDYVNSVAGLGRLGFAVICAEAVVPIAEYRTVSGLWKHMGFAVIDGRRQQGVAGKRKDPEEAMKLFHPKERRGQLYGFLQDSLFRAQWNAGKLTCDTCAKLTKFTWEDEDVPVCEVCGTRGEAADVVSAHPVGHYGEVYARRRAHTAPRVVETDHLDPKDPSRWSLKRCHSDATRVMAKAVLRDLWRVSRGMPPRKLGDQGE